MKHEEFPVPGFEFMNQPATEEQKDLIAELAKAAGSPIDRNGVWPEPFTRWDASNMIEILKVLSDDKR